MSSTAVESAACHNCGAALRGPVGAHCGQDARPLDPTLREVVGEVAREVSALDGRILRSVRRLFLSPGFLTLEHFKGRRASWVSPVRLYLISASATSPSRRTPAAHPSTSICSSPAGATKRRDARSRTSGFPASRNWTRPSTQALTTWIPRAMFVLVPLFGWLVSLVRRGSGRHYPHHVIFACHGIRGTAPAGEKIADERDPKSGVRIFSLYKAEDRGPTPEMLRGVDVDARAGRDGHERARPSGNPLRSDCHGRRRWSGQVSGQTIPAIRFVRFVISDREAYRPVRTSLMLIDEIRRQHPKEFEWCKSIDRLTGSDKVRRAIESGTLPALLDQWDREAAAFRERRKAFLLYE